MGLPRFAVLALLAAVLYFFVSPRRGASEAGTYYAALGLSPTADVKAIRAAFKLQALRSHPDKLESRRKALSAKIGVLGRLWRAATDADRTEAAQFLRISEAVDVLADDDRRAAYDLQLEADRARREQSRAGQGRPMAYYLGNSVPRRPMLEPAAWWSSMSRLEPHHWIVLIIVFTFLFQFVGVPLYYYLDQPATTLSRAALDEARTRARARQQDALDAKRAPPRGLRRRSPAPSDAPPVDPRRQNAPDAADDERE